MYKLKTDSIIMPLVPLKYICLCVLCYRIANVSVDYEE